MHSRLLHPPTPLGTAPDASPRGPPRWPPVRRMRYCAEIPRFRLPTSRTIASLLGASNALCPKVSGFNQARAHDPLGSWDRGIPDSSITPAPLGRALEMLTMRTSSREALDGQGSHRPELATVSTLMSAVPTKSVTRALSGGASSRPMARRQLDRPLGTINALKQRVGWVIPLPTVVPWAHSSWWMGSRRHREEGGVNGRGSCSECVAGAWAAK